MKVYDKGALAVGLVWGLLGALRLWVNGTEDWLMILLSAVLSVRWLYEGLSKKGADNAKRRAEENKRACEAMFGSHARFWSSDIYLVLLLVFLLLTCLPYPYPVWSAVPLGIMLVYAIWLTRAIKQKNEELDLEACQTLRRVELEGVDASYHFLVEKEEMWAKMLMKALTDNNIPCSALPVYGAGVTARTGMQERLKIYVPEDKHQQARELMAELFPEDKES